MKLFRNLFLILMLLLASSSFAWAHGNHFHSLNDVKTHIEDGDVDECVSEDQRADSLISAEKMDEKSQSSKWVRMQKRV